MQMYAGLAATLLFAHVALISQAHRPAVNGVTCGNEFSTIDTALHIHDVTIEWSANRVATCDQPVFWLKYDVPEEQVGKKLYLSAGSVHPAHNKEAARFNDIRFDALLLGPGLPTLNRSALPSYVAVPDDMTTGSIYRSPDSIATCAHSEWMGAMDDVLDVTDGICTFFEEFTKTHMSVVLDVTPEAKAAGTHYTAVWVRGHQSAKLWYAVGVVGGREDFWSSFDIPRGNCNCGDSNDFNEKDDMPISVPKVVSCSASPEFSEYCEEPKDHGGHGGGMGMDMSMDMGNMSMGCGNMQCGLTWKYIMANMKMHAGMAIPFSCNVELDFVLGMIAHHQGGMDMCNVMLAENELTDSGLVHFCEHVGMEQGMEVGVMYSWLASKRLMGSMGKKCNDTTAMGCGDMSCEASKEWMAANHRMHEGMKINFTCANEVDFVRQMIPHHQGAVEMCEILNLYGSADAMLLDLCRNITRVQRSEIMWMSRWLHNEGAAVEAPCKSSPPAPAACEDMLIISESCHQMGGDRACSCEKVIEEHACGTVAMTSRSFNVTEVCLRTCGQCPPRPHSKVGSHDHHHDDSMVPTSATSAAQSVNTWLLLVAAFFQARSLLEHFML